jgi:hypothetical protein
MLPYRDSWITRIVLVVFFLLVVGYAYFEAQGILFGPSISVTSSVTTVHDPFVKIEGRADRIASLSMNGKQIAVTESGSFSEPYLLAAGDNRIVLDAKDTYGRTRRKVIEIVYISDPSTVSTTSAGSGQASSGQASSSTGAVAQ